eukprot:2695077-Amphidinium_carterae.2
MKKNSRETETDLNATVWAPVEYDRSCWKLVVTSTGKVFTVEMHHTRMDQANPGDNVGLNIKGHFDADE